MYLENLDRSLIIIEIYQLFLFALILLFYGYKKTTSKKILAVFFLDAGIYYLALGMYYLGNYQITVLLYHFFVPAILALYPLFYLYVKSLTNQNFSLDSRKLFHFLPSLLFFLINTPVFVMLSPEQSKWFVIYGFTETGTGLLLQLVTKIYYLWNFVVFPLQIIFYTYLIIKKIREHKNLIKELFSNLQKKQLNWLIWCITLFFALLVINNALLQTEALDDIIIRVGYNISMIAITAFLGFAGLRQIDIYKEIADEEINHIDNKDIILADQNENEIHQQNNITKKGRNNKYVTSSLSEKEKEEIVSVLEYIMLTKKLFLNPDLKMTDIVSEISLPRKQISQVINENLNDNFYNYINRYRIEESKRLLENIKFDRFSIEGIAKQSGFNSRSSFYAAFKNETGITPSQFQHLCKT